MKARPKMISSAFPYKKQRRRVLGQEMAYVDMGQGDPIVLLHGNPTSSYLWRNVLPHLRPLGRCIALDLIGMGDSDGGAAVLGPLGQIRNAPSPAGVRSEAGEQTVLQDNFFIEKVLPGAILRKLSEEEMAGYRRPFTEPGEGRRPTLTFPREIPIEGDPADVTAAVDAYANWLKTSSVPKLFLKAEPGGILAEGKVLEQARSFPAQSEVTIKGVHFVQEDSPDEIGQAVKDVELAGRRRWQCREERNGDERSDGGARPWRLG
jgi:pimeloyl-ACP methyl ester carboxylesterase